MNRPWVGVLVAQPIEREDTYRDIQAELVERIKRAYDHTTAGAVLRSPKPRQRVAQWKRERQGYGRR